MQLSYLRYRVAVAEELYLPAAAERLHIVSTVTHVR
jgi:DNA-binding transcriptional LysR family regulator